MPRRQFCHARRQFARGKPVQMFLDGRPQIGCGVRNLHLFRTKLDCAAKIIFDAGRFAAKKNFRSNTPSRRSFWPGCQPLELLFQPSDVAGCKISGGGNGSGTRNRHAHRAVRPQPEQVTAGAQMAHHQQRQAAREPTCRESVVGAGCFLNLNIRSKIIAWDFSLAGCFPLSKFPPGASLGAAPPHCCNPTDTSAEEVSAAASGTRKGCPTPAGLPRRFGVLLQPRLEGGLLAALFHEPRNPPDTNPIETAAVAAFLSRQEDIHLGTVGSWRSRSQPGLVGISEQVRRADEGALVIGSAPCPALPVRGGCQASSETRPVAGSNNVARSQRKRFVAFVSRPPSPVARPSRKAAMAPGPFTQAFLDPRLSTFHHRPPPRFVEAPPAHSRGRNSSAPRRGTQDCP